MKSPYGQLYPIYLELNEEHLVSPKDDIIAAINDIRSMGVISPFDNREIIIDDNVQLNVSMFDGALWISSIYTLDKGTGGASVVLKKVCDIADKHGVIIRLSPEPFGNGKKLSKSQLVSWYKRNGFKSIKYGQMERVPIR